MKPQVNTPKPPQFQGEGIDPRRALLVLGLPATAVAVTLLVLFATPLVWWIAAGVAATGVAGGVLLRRSGRARGIARRLPGVQRAAAGLRRMPNGRFARSPLGRAVNRALGRSPAGGRAGGQAGGQAGGRAGGAGRSAGGRLRAMLPSWAGGTRNRPAARPGGAGSSPAGGRPGGRMRAMLSRLTPGGRRRAAAAGGASGSASGGRPGKPGGGSGGSRPKSTGLLSRAASATGRAGQATKAKLFGTRGSGASASSPSGSGKPKGKGKNRPGGGGKPTPSDVDLGVVWRGLGTAGRLASRGFGAMFEQLHGLRRRHEHDQDDDFDPSKTYETGIEGTAVDGKYLESDLGEIAKRAKTAAKKRAKEAGKAQEDEPEWPNVEPHDGSWPATDPEDGTAVPPPAAPARELPAEQDPDPPPNRETPRPTSANIKQGGSMSAADQYVQMIDRSTPVTYAASCLEAADTARRDAGRKEEEGKTLRREAETFAALPGAANHKMAQDLRAEADQCEQDAQDRLQWAGRLDEMANNAANAA